ncbi:MAG: SDR family oxidoreductase [Brevinema sp.]
MKKLIVITGASSGIGAATAKKLSNEGYPLLLLARRVDQMETLNLPNTLCRKVDILDIDTFQSAIQEAEAKFGAVDCLINNAGVMLLGTPSEQSLQEWNTMIDVNVKGLLNGIHLVLKGMIERNHGTIINISSIAGRKTFPNHAVYCGTKFAVHAISENIRQEVSSHNIRVSIVAPGVTETELMNHTTDMTITKNYHEWKKTMGSGLDAQDIANTISFIYNQPQRVCIREIDIAPTKQES